jgi:hypothetical protein
MIGVSIQASLAPPAGFLPAGPGLYDFSPYHGTDQKKGREPMAELLKVSGIKKAFAGVQALRGVSL